MKKQVTLSEYIKHHGYTEKEFDACVGELCKNGVARGCYDDYNLLALVIGWCCNYKSEVDNAN